MKSRTMVGPMLVAALALLAATGCSEPATEGADTEATATTVVDGCSPATLLDCAPGSSLADYLPDEPTEATGEPITLGMINQENTPAASFPELSLAAQAAIDWVNEQLGGVDGRPIELEVCNTGFSAEGSTACGQQFVEAGVPAVLGGIDVFGNSIDVLGDNGIPFVGGIPVSNQSGVAENSFQFSGGTWGSAIAFADHAASELQAETVAVIYAEFGSITQSAEFAEKVLTDRGVETQMIPYPVLATDLSSAIDAAASSDPDAVLVLAADSGCKAGFNGIAAKGIEAQTYYVGACAAPTILASVPASETDGVIVNVEGPIMRTDPDVDTALYSAVVAAYAEDLDAAGAGTVTFRSFINLYMVLRDLGADGISSEAIMDAFRAKVDAPSFMGHPYTCDGRQLEGLPALCSPQQILAGIENRELTQIGTWIDVGEIFG